MATQYLTATDGTLAYEEYGGPEQGQVILMTPGIGDLRAEYRLLAPALITQGFRPVSMDLRGTGDSSTQWSEYTPAAVGADMLALARHLNRGAVWLMGTSMAAASAVWAAVESPSSVRGIILAGPSLEDVALGTGMKLAMQVAFAGPWQVAAWMAFYKSLYPHAQPADFAAYCASLRANLRERGRFASVRAFLNASKGAASARLGKVQQPSLIIMGDSDPDFSDPGAQARRWADVLGGDVAMITKSGHYPHVDAVDQVAAEITRWIHAHSAMHTEAAAFTHSMQQQAQAA